MRTADNREIGWVRISPFLPKPKRFELMWVRCPPRAVWRSSLIGQKQVYAHLKGLLLGSWSNRNGWLLLRKPQACEKSQKDSKRVTHYPFHSGQQKSWCEKRSARRKWDCESQLLSNRLIVHSLYFKSVLREHRRVVYRLWNVPRGYIRKYVRTA